MKNKLICIILISLGQSGVAISQIAKIDSPVKNFEKLWNTFDERYANFELKKVNWHELHKKYKPLINEETTNVELFEICCLMLQELSDGHVTIEPNFKDDDIECGPPYSFNFDVTFDTVDEIGAFVSVMENEFLENGFSKPIKKTLSEDTNFQYRVSESLGYLRLDEMTEKITFGKFNRAVDESMKAFQNKKGLIVDLRFNGGGWDHNSYQLASRFIPDGKTIGHFKRTKIKGQERYSPMKYKKVESGGKTPFEGPFVILTSDYTASAAEVFIMLMKELSNVTIVGDNTEGIFSDMYEFKLPNKWKVSLSHQQFFSQEKVNFEGVGIPPDIRIKNSKSDIEQENDPVIQIAIDLLKSKTSANSN